MSKRGEAMAAADALLRALSKIDEVEAQATAARGARDAAKAEHAEAAARLERTKQAAAEAEAEHQTWLETTQRQRLQGNAEIDRLQHELQTLQSAIAEKHAESDNILAGIKALTARLKVG